MVAINIIGTVGAGKSTLAKKLQKELNIPVGFEADSEELSEETRKLLTEYYSDPNKYALKKNMYFLKQRANTLEKNKTNDIYISDRFLYDDYLMAKLNFINGQLSESEWHTYSDEFSKIEKMFGKSDESNDILIFIVPTFKQTLQQIKQRGRDEEQIENNPELEAYYETMYNLYLKMFKDWDDTPMFILKRVEETDIHKLSTYIKLLIKDRKS